MSNAAPSLEEDVPKWNILRRLYNWMLSWSGTKYALPALVIFAFLESSVFPIPPDVLLIPLVLGALSKWWKIALYCTIASVAGGMLGYAIGVFAWEGLGLWIVENIAHKSLVDVDGKMDIPLPRYLVENFSSSLGGEYLFQVYDKWNAWIVYVFGLTPLPYKLVTITAGVARVDFGVFVVASILARGTRFFAVAAIIRLMGNRAKEILDKHFNVLCVVFTIVLIAGFAAVKLLF